jgi:hypothetical protein
MSMNGLHPQPIGHGGALTPQAFSGLAMTPRQDDLTYGIKPGTVEMRLATLAALPPADDPETPVVELHLTEDDLIEMRRLAENLKEAVALANAAEQRHSAALHESRKIPALIARSGLLSARAVGGSAEAKLEVKRLLEQLDDARLAEQALKTLADEAAEAQRFKDACYGRLRVYTVKAFARMRQRAAREYADAVDRLRKATACMAVSIEMDNKTMQPSFLSWHTQFVGKLVVPALPDELRAGTNGVEAHATGPMLMNFSHSYYTGAQSAIRSKLQTQIAEACGCIGLRADNIL